MGAVAPVSAQVALVWTLTALLCVLIVIALSTVGESIRAARRDRREAAAVSRVTSGLFDRLDADDPDWAGWVEDLSSIEERVLRARVDRYLRVLAGSDGRRFAALGAGHRGTERPGTAGAAGRAGVIRDVFLSMLAATGWFVLGYYLLVNGSYVIVHVASLAALRAD